MLSSLQNPLVKQIRKLHQAKGRREQQQFLLEGTHVLEAACAVACPLLTLCYTEEWQQQNPLLWHQATQTAQRAEVVTAEVLKTLATTVHPDGVVATVDRTAASPPIPQFTSLGLVLEAIQDPGNLGTMIRTAAAAGVEGLWVSEDSVDLDHPKVLRASAGQWFRLPMAVQPNLRQAVAQSQHQGMQVVATVPKATLTYWQIDLRSPTLILLGNEGGGLGTDLAALADHQVSIPLQAEVESLNVAIVAALIVYEAQRQRSL